MVYFIAFSNLFFAVGLKESSGNPNEINIEEKAYGIFQIRQAALTDINKKYGTRYKLTDFLGDNGVPLSFKAFLMYGEIYKAKTPEEYCRIWNGGPLGMMKPATRTYWLGVLLKAGVARPSEIEVTAWEYK